MIRTPTTTVGIRIRTRTGTTTGTRILGQTTVTTLGEKVAEVARTPGEKITPGAKVMGKVILGAKVAKVILGAKMVKVKTFQARIPGAKVAKLVRCISHHHHHQKGQISARETLAREAQMALLGRHLLGGKMEVENHGGSVLLKRISARVAKEMRPRRRLGCHHRHPRAMLAKEVHSSLLRPNSVEINLETKGIGVVTVTGVVAVQGLTMATIGTLISHIEFEAWPST